jgi:putative ABC transport system ATP-binding protein
MINRGHMERSLFKYILKNSVKEQVWILLLVCLTLPFYYLMLYLPKVIINRVLAIETGGYSFDFTVFGHAIPKLEPISLLITLCAFFLLTLAIQGGFKYVVNIRKGILAERILRQLRLELCSRLLRFPLPQFSNVSPGEVIPMVTSEAEPLGGFVGDMIAVPALQGGLLFTAFLFILVQEPLLGLVAVGLFPIQAIVIARLQKRVNILGRERVREVRRGAVRARHP